MTLRSSDGRSPPRFLWASMRFQLRSGNRSSDSGKRRRSFKRCIVVPPSSTRLGQTTGITWTFAEGRHVPECSLWPHRASTNSYSGPAGACLRAPPHGERHSMSPGIMLRSGCSSFGSWSLLRLVSPGPSIEALPDGITASALWVVAVIATTRAQQRHRIRIPATTQVMYPHRVAGDPGHCSHAIHGSRPCRECCGEAPRSAVTPAASCTLTVAIGMSIVASIMSPPLRDLVGVLP